MMARKKPSYFHHMLNQNLDEDEPEVQLPKPPVDALEGLQMLTDYAATNHLDNLAPFIIQTRKQLVKLWM